MSEKDKDLSEELSAPGPLADKIGKGYPGVDTSNWTEDDHKRFDEKGNTVVEGELWSKAHTGIYMTLYGAFAATPIDRQCRGKSLILNSRSGHPVYFTVMTTTGKPRVGVQGFGASLELPSDLGRDPSKQEYVTEWLLETTQEILAETGGVLRDTDQFAVWLLGVGNDSINQAGL